MFFRFFLSIKEFEILVPILLFLKFLLVSGKFLTSVFPGMMLPLKQILLNQSYIKLYYWIKAISNYITDLAQET